MTQTDPDEVARSAAVDFVRRLVPHVEEALSRELLGAYLIGSLAHAGFSRRYSDIDIALVTEAGLSPPALDRVRGEAVTLSADWGPKVSVFWADRHFSLGRFPLLDRIDYLDYAVVLMERESVRPARPTLEEIQHYLRGVPFANWADRARSFAAAETLEPKDRKEYLRTLLSRRSRQPVQLRYDLEKLLPVVLVLRQPRPLARFQRERLPGCRPLALTHVGDGCRCIVAISSATPP